MQVRAVTGTYRDDLPLLDDRLTALGRHASAAQSESIGRAMAELGRYGRLHPRADESPDAFQRRAEQQWYAVLYCLDEFLDLHAEDDTTE